MDIESATRDHGEVLPSRHASHSSSSTMTTQPSRSHQADLEPEKQHDRSLSPIRSKREINATSDLSLTRTVSARENFIARLRSRQPTGRGQFSHPLAHTKTAGDVIVDFDSPEDVYRPLNWPLKKKVITTACYGLTTMGATWASAVFSPGTAQVARQFDVSMEVAVLGTALFMCGLGFGPLIWAPVSEVYGRKIAVLVPYFIGMVFLFGTGAAKDFQTVAICRFFAGFFGSAPVTNTGGVLADLYAPAQRGIALVGYAMAVVAGPSLGPIAGGAIVQSYLRWRWTEYITGIWMGFMLIVDVLFIDESFPPVLLVYKARRLRHETGNWALHARHEEWDVSVRELAQKFLIRPFQMLMTPICFLVALYSAFVYGILYLSLGSFPIIFQEQRGWGQVIGQLPFLSLLVGIVLGAFTNIFNQKYYIGKVQANDGKPVPEARLPPMMVGSVVFASSLFIMGWTADKRFPWIAPCIGAAMMGYGIFTIIQAALNYLVDTFRQYSASAVAANTFLRSIMAAGLALAVNPMYHKLGVDWASSLLGFFAIVMIPIPYLFFVFGKRLRARGKWSADVA